MAQFVRFRAWLEPGYDHGRFGAWMLDLPGCFAWANDRSSALAAVPSAVDGYIAWIGRHGEAVAPGELAAWASEGRLGAAAARRVDVVEEVPATEVDGYERNATFAADRRAVDAAEVDYVSRVLGYARSDLLELMDRMERHEAANGRLGSEPDGVRRSRSARGVLRHIGGAEIWLAGRLDGSLRYEGPDFAEGERRYLAATRRWAIDTVRALHRRDPALERTDAKGETWTLAKVLRRLVYHSLDHLAEIDRRLLAAGEGGE